MEYKEAFERIKIFCNSDNGYPYNQYLQSSTPRNEDLETIEKALEEYSKLKDKIKNGTLVELPCKVGDKVYYISGTKQICEAIVEPHGNMFYGAVYLDKKSVIGSWFNSRDIGKEFFLTREEAEAKLKELKDNE